jgi:hypothetical protein
MTELSLHLPPRKLAKALLAKLDQESQKEFQSELLDALWDEHEAEGLPTRITVLLRDWIAHAHFEDSPLAQERLANARRRASSV